jgi:transcriptional regulator with XRE-family HTH domain
MFSQNLKKYRKLEKLSQKELAQKISYLINKNIEDANVRSWENGTNPKIEVITAIAEILDVPEQYLFDDSKETLNKIVSKEAPNLKSMVEHTKKIPLLNGYVGAGSSGIIEKLEVSKYLYIDTCLVKKAYQNKEIMALTVIGDSMIPYVDNNDIILYHPIEKGQYNFIDGKYVIETMNGVMIKNLCFKCNGDIVISSCNRTYSDEIIKCDETQEYLDIVGVAVGRLLKS